MLIDSIQNEDIQVGIQAEDWQDAIRKSAQRLLDIGAIEESYIDAMIDVVKKNGPYIVIAKGIALAHARPECGVNQIALSFATFDPPIPFGADALDPVTLVISLAATDPDSHLDVLGELADILSEPNRLQALLHAKTRDEFFDELTR